MSDEEIKEEALLVEEVEATIEESSEIHSEEVKDLDDEKAKAKGWKPKEEFEGDPKDWRDSKTFLEKGELLDAIHALKRSDKENREMIEKLNEHNKKIEEVAFKKALASLRDEHRAAVEVGDVVKAEELTDRLVEMSVAPHAQPKAPEQIPELSEFLDRNKGWFNNNTPENAAMSAYASNLEVAIAKEDPSLAPKDVLMKVEAAVRSKFPSRFRSSGRAASAVAAPKPVSSGKSPNSLEGLSDFHKDFIHTMKHRYKNFDTAAYIKQIRSIEESKK